LNIHEHAAHSLLNDYGIATPKFGIAKSPNDVEKIAKDLMTRNLMVKAQVLAGGRGLGKFENGFHGGVQTAIR
jgi:succinyl-CoA synthetase beta subunit